MKECSKCHQLLNESYFNKDKGKADGLSVQCKQCANIRAKQYYEDNTEKCLNRQKAYTMENREQINKKKKEHYWQNRDKITEVRRGVYVTYKDDPTYKLNRNFAKAVWEVLKENKNYSHWFDLVPYTLQELKEHLESQFTPEMNWQNMGSYWEIDHIIPKTQFIYTDYTDLAFQICWSLANLRPLEKSANRSRPKDGSDISNEIKDEILGQAFNSGTMVL